MTSSSKLDRQGLQVLDDEECRRLLAATPVGRVALVLEGEPLVLPVNHVVDRGDIVFRTGEGTKLAMACREPGSTVAFEADGYDVCDRTGWSVVAHGTLHPVSDQGEVERLDQLELHPWAEIAERRHWVRVRVERLSGRRILPRGA